jgi:3-oxoacyl-[acyl-carrier-protein] synthase-3
MNQSDVGVLGLGAYVPERVMTNDDWAQYVDTTDEWITSRTGIKTRRIAADDQTTVDLAAAAAERALADAGATIEEIDEIIIATDTPEVYIPDTASFLQDRLGAREIPAFDMAGSGCAGFVFGLDIACSRAMHRDRKILVVGVELLTRFLDWTDRSTVVLFGDAAGAAVIGSGEDASEILGFTAGTDGSQAGILTLESGGTRKPFTLESAQRGEHKDIVMKGREVFREAVSRMTRSADEVLNQAGLGVGDVDLIIPHQANMRIIKAVQKVLAAPDEKLFVNVQDYGNTGSASIPLALWEARQHGRANKGDLVLMTAFGAGFHWAAMLMRL